MEVSGLLRAPAALPRESNPVPFVKKATRFGKEKNLLRLLRFDPRTIQPVAQSVCYSGWHFILTDISVLALSNVYFGVPKFGSRG